MKSVVLFGMVLALATPSVTAQFMGIVPVFSEIFPTIEGGDAAEFIEIYNPTGETLSLSGYRVCDSTMSTCTDLVGTLAPDSYFVLCRDVSQHMRCNLGTRLFLKRLSNLILINPSFDAIDSVTWSTQNVPAGSTYVRGLNTLSPLAFVWFPSSSPGAGFLGGPDVTPAPSARPSEDSEPPSASPTHPPTELPSRSPTGSPTTESPTALDACANDPCHPLATCLTVGNSFTCQCPPGYSGNGFTTGCRDIDECSADPYPCDPNAFCVDSDGSFACTCFSGFTGNGFSCTNVNECLTLNPCSSVARCEDKNGGFDCFCNAGYQGNGITCLDVDECLPGGTNNCSPNADCNNNEGSFSCKCRTGFEGDGTFCNSLTPAPTPRPTPDPTPRPTPDPSPRPTRASVVPSASPSRSQNPSFSQEPSSFSPSIRPSRSNLPSITSFPSAKPSRSNLPSITSFPSSKPSRD